MPVDVRDAHLAETLNRALLVAVRLVQTLVESEAKDRAIEVAKALEEDLRKLGVPVIGNPRLKSVISRIPEGKGFGFITGEDGREFFSHFGAFPNLHRSDQHAVGDEVTFQIGYYRSPDRDERPCAINCDIQIDI